ncbi:PREDICTED: LOW QUALITY PROTEIN: bcl-2-like protein 15 [Dipodomys ordii]|uniref:LOW QUALITY PROTEIN: bcl-2-like protein 15 n=1 Tax=Dipodomys ordii TaxID=10020 RepID=A0A1S3FUM1_DIPOR|nr:PREDICTED: LOW QUALITY PROTEIN: bcl-2-like protein 15 [Dipodomys ordii]
MSNLSFEEQTKHTVNALFKDFLTPLQPANQSGGMETYSVVHGAWVLCMSDRCEPPASGPPVLLSATPLMAILSSVGSYTLAWYAQDSSFSHERAFLALLVKLLESVARMAPKKVEQLTAPVVHVISRNKISGTRAIQEFIQKKGGWKAGEQRRVVLLLTGRTASLTNQDIHNFWSLKRQINHLCLGRTQPS